MTKIHDPRWISVSLVAFLFQTAITTKMNCLKGHHLSCLGIFKLAIWIAIITVFSKCKFDCYFWCLNISKISYLSLLSSHKDKKSWIGVLGTYRVYIFVCAYMHMNKETYYKGLAPGIMEVEKSTPRRSDSVNSDWSLSPINRRVDGGNSSSSPVWRQKTAVLTHGQWGRVQIFSYFTFCRWLARPTQLPPI